MAGRRAGHPESGVLLLDRQLAHPCLGRFPHDALHRTGRAGRLDQLLFGGRRLAGRHLPEHDVRLHLDVAGAGRAAVRHHPL